MMNNKEHLTKEGLRAIAIKASQMNRLTISRYLESSETIRQTNRRINGRYSPTLAAMQGDTQK